MHTLRCKIFLLDLDLLLVIVATVVFILCLLIKYCRLEDGEEKIDCQEIDEYGGLHCYETKSFSEPPSDHCLDWTCTTISPLRCCCGLTKL